MKNQVFLFAFLAISFFANATTNSWTGNGGDAKWSTASNWSSGNAPLTSDDVQFNNSSSVAVTIDVATININSLSINGTADVTFSASTTVTINLGKGGTGSTALNIVASRTLTLENTAAVGIVIVIPTRYTASIYGTLSLSAYNSTTLSQKNQLKGTDQGSVVFYNGANCIGGAGQSSSQYPFNNSGSVYNIVIFQSGANFSFYSGASVFGNGNGPNAYTQFQSGSTYTHYTNTISNSLDMKGRSYSNVIIDMGSANSITAGNTVATTSSMDSLVINSGKLVLVGNYNTVLSTPTSFSIGNITIGSSANTNTCGLTLGTITSNNYASNFSISGNIILNNTNSSINLGMTNGTTYATTTNITFSGTGKSISGVSSSNVNVSDVGGNSYKTNFYIAPNASLTLNTSLNLTTSYTIVNFVVQPLGTLTVGSGATLTTNGNLTIQSDASGDGSIDKGSGIISGNVTVQKWIPAQRAYTVFSTPFNSQQSIKSITDSVLVTGLSIKGTGTYANSSGNPSCFTYNATAVTGAAITPVTDATTSVWDYTQPVYVFIRGKANEGNGLSSGQSGDTYTSGGGPTSFAIAAKGGINNSSVAPLNLQYSSGANNYNLIGNPYPRSINLKLLTSNGMSISTNSNLGGTFYVYNPYKGSTGKALFSGGYDTYSNDGSTDVIVPIMGAFFIQTKAAGQTIEFNESTNTAFTSSSQINQYYSGNQLVCDNGVLKVMFDTSKGGAISYISLSNSTTNLVNIYDNGRYISQSYYAGNAVDRTAEGQNASWSPWRWNPVQAGDSYHNNTHISNVIKNGFSVYTRCIPLHWDMNNSTVDAYMEQWNYMDSNVIKVHCKLTCNSIESVYGQNVSANQELPAVYPISALNNLYGYLGSKPFTSDTVSNPSVVNLSSGFWGKYNGVSENWMAFVDNTQWGMGVYNPSSNYFLAGMSGSSGGDYKSNSTCYIAPIANATINSNSVYEYDYYIIIGSVDQIRSWVYKLH